MGSIKVKIRKKRDSKAFFWRLIFLCKDLFEQKLFWKWRIIFLSENKLHEEIIKPYEKLYREAIGGNPNKSMIRPPAFRPASAVLRTEDEYLAAVQEIQSLKLPLYPVGCIQKNWDSLAALSLLLGHTDRESSILDAGGYYYSPILPWMVLYGYVHLTALNLAFKKETKIGNIVYKPGDLTKTEFADQSFDAITCISVIEHGIDVEKYFKEMSRLLKPNGILFISADYWPESIETRGFTLFGAPFNIFNRTRVLQTVEEAIKNNLELLSPIQLEAQDKVVHWKEFKFTFLYFALKKSLMREANHAAC